MRLDMRVGMRTDMRMDMHMGMCIGKHTDMCMDMHMGIVWTCVWTICWAYAVHQRQVLDEAGSHFNHRPGICCAISKHADGERRGSVLI